jgi:hypothetical protein
MGRRERSRNAGQNLHNRKYNDFQTENSTITTTQQEAGPEGPSSITNNITQYSKCKDCLTEHNAIQNIIIQHDTIYQA